jgi:hypothetical protein
MNGRPLMAVGDYVPMLALLQSLQTATSHFGIPEAAPALWYAKRGNALVTASESRMAAGRGRRGVSQVACGSVSFSNGSNISGLFAKCDRSFGGKATNPEDPS